MAKLEAQGIVEGTASGPVLAAVAALSSGVLLDMIPGGWAACARAALTGRAPEGRPDRLS